MSFVLLGILNSQAAGVAEAYFLNVLGASGNEESNGVQTDSQGNVYNIGYSDATGSNKVVLAKYDSSGINEFQRALGDGSLDIAYDLAIDSSDNLYGCGFTSPAGAGGEEFLLAKWNSSGTIQWQRILGGGSSERARSVSTDSSGNVYVAGYTRSTGSGQNDFLLAKYNSSGTIQWQRIVGGVEDDRAYAITIDSSDNIYIGGFQESDTVAPSRSDALLVKYNTSGTVQWQRSLGGSQSDRYYGLTTDSSGNIYGIGNTASAGAGNNDFLLAKWNSSGTLQWQRVLGGTGQEEGWGVSTDSSGDVYVAGLTDSTGEGGNDFLLAKYNSSGTIQWQRVLGGSGADSARSMTIDSSDNILVTGSSNSTGAGGNDFFLAKLPNDGSLEGTYSLDGNNIVYQASSLTAATSSLTASTVSLAASTSSLTSATSTLTESSASLTSVTLDITP